MGINFIDKDTEGALLETKGLLRRVRSAAGAARYGVPINSVIPAGGKPGGRAPRPTATPTHVSTRVNAPEGGASIKPIKGLNRDLDEAVLKGRITIRRAREIQKRRNERLNPGRARAEKIMSTPEWKKWAKDLDDVRETLGQGWKLDRGEEPMLRKPLGNGNFRFVAHDAYSDTPGTWAIWEWNENTGEQTLEEGELTKAQMLAAVRRRDAADKK